MHFRLHFSVTSIRANLMGHFPVFVQYEYAYFMMFMMLSFLMCFDRFDVAFCILLPLYFMDCLLYYLLGEL